MLELGPFACEFDLTLDEKGRVLVPAPLKRRIYPEHHGEAFYLVVSSDRKNLLMYPDKYYEWLMTRNDQPEAYLTEQEMELNRYTFGMASLVEPDKAGRILIPERARDRVGITKDIMFIGAKTHIELWDAIRWEAEGNLILESAKKNRQMARKFRSGMPEHVTSTMSVTATGGQI